jgi:hypothetical protein
MPRTMRELLQLFALYDPEKGLAALFDRLDFSDVRPHQIYQIAHRRLPESMDLALRRKGYDAREHLTAALHSAEFQENILRNILISFPEKSRDVFIHVPKCAGTDLILNIGPRRLVLPKMIEVESWVDKPELFLALRDLIQAMPYYDRLFVYGHIPLSYYADRVGIRAGDQVFSVIREPFDLMLSQANYAVTRMRQDPLGQAPDTREIMGMLGIERMPEVISVAEIRDLVRCALTHPKITQPNRACFYLGGEENPSYEAAMNNVVMHNVELTTTERYREWLQSRWDIAAKSRHNESDHWLTRQDITGDLADLLRERTAEDCKFFAMVSRVLEQAAVPAVSGLDIAERAGPDLFGALVNFIAEERAQPSLPGSGRRLRDEPMTIQGRNAIDAHLRDEALERSLELDFGIGGTGQRLLRDGWASPEDGFTWTVATVCTLELPKPTKPGDYRLRLTVGPFAVKDRYPSQRLTLALRGITLGTAVVTERALVEYDIPQPVLGGDPVVELTMTLPDAVCPRSLTDADDERLLAFAIERLELFYLPAPVAEQKGEESADAAAADGDIPVAPPKAIEPAEAIEPSEVIEPPEAKPIEPIVPSAPPVSPVSMAGEPADATFPEGEVVTAVEPPVLDRRELMMRFESLGENCELGLVQRRCGAEPLGLFRFASAPFAKLMEGLAARFEGLGEADKLEVELSDNGREYMVRDHRFGFLYHAWVLAGEMRPEDVHRREVRRLPLLIRKLSEDLSVGEKIFVYHQMDQPLSAAQARQLASALSAYGPSTLLWVELAEPDHPAGTAEWIEPGLIKGFVDRFAPGENAHDLSIDCWVAVCQSAYRLWCGRSAEMPLSGMPAARAIMEFETVEA